MASLWSRISNIGIVQGMEREEHKRAKLTNQVSASVSAMAFGYVFVFYFLGFEMIALYIFGAVAIIATPLVLNYNKHYMLSRVWFIIAINLAVLFFAYLLGKGSGLMLALFSMSAIPWAFFELRQIRYIIGGVLLSMVCYYIYDITKDSVPSLIPADVQRFVHWSLIVVEFSIISLVLYFFARQNTKAEEFLVHANASLQEGREELMQQQEELQQPGDEPGRLSRGDGAGARGDRRSGGHGRTRASGGHQDDAEGHTA